MSIGANIKKRRFELHITQQELADAMGYKTRATIAKIESGENDISQKKLQKIAQILETTPEILINGSNTDNSISPASNTVTSAYISSNKNVVVILAGGKSSRNQQNIPNQFINIMGKPVIVYCMEAYQSHPAIDDIYVVCLRGWETIVKAYAEQYNITKLKGIVSAGNTGIMSVKNSLDTIKSHYRDDDVIIFQESTRPNITVEIISKLLQACDEKGSANICMPMRDHLQFIVSESKESVADRETTVEVQSPEAYKFSVISSIFKKAEEQNHELTESCGAMLLYNLGHYVNFVEGSVNNVKIIKQEDIAVFSTILNQRNLY